MTSSTQQTDLSHREISALRLLAIDARAKIDKQLEDDLYAKGLLHSAWDRCLSPAGRDAIHIERTPVGRYAHG
ncbi:hypothetical protein [Cognatilysobacter lacus]|uniref:Uncharacterized protein n=1 Tax=Cognatilysobacter lacus TaxID=1643323 RepID=A0A5D8ZBX5_9GAMM|nr:hypothetical protein [Lysobacter lacus]TZF91553.1 hypothetical protein FW784_01425 [Lysobacter lacus]